MVYPCKPQFCYTEVEFKGGLIIEACFRYELLVGCSLVTWL